MDLNRSTSEALHQPCGAGQATGVRTSECYVEPAPVADILVDQLRYLLRHKAASCTHNCPDCERLAGAQSWLLLPFRATATRGFKPPENISIQPTASRARL